MDDTNSLIEQRTAKLAALRAKGIDPFQNKFSPTETCAAARGNYVEGREVAVAGRITAHREMGKSIFIDVRDQSGRLQVYAQKNVLGDEQWHIFTHLDLGDFVGVRGHLFTTKTGEISIKLASFTILAKALRPPPAKYYGLEDTEIRYRQRYLDLIANPDVKDVMLKRSAIVHEIRQFFHSRGYVEVETPAMQAIPGGAAAQPFKTFHNALGCEFYLRIALELYHKRLLVGGIDKLFEIGKNFRNEGLSRRHNPEFTMLEAYQAFGDYNTMMETVESLIKHVAQKIWGTLKIPRKQNGAVAAAIDRAVKALDEYSAQEFANIDQRTPAENKTYAESIRSFRTQLWDLRNSLDTKPGIEVAMAAALAIRDWAGEIITAKATPEIKAQIEKLQKFEQVEQLATPIAASLAEGLKGPLFALFFEIEHKEIDLTNWKKAKYKDLVREFVGSDWFDITPQERRRRAIEELKLGGDIGTNYEDFEVTGAVFEKLIEPTLIEPTFVTHLPKELVPLAKLTPDDPTTVEVFECCINGQEISPGYTEQNDPIQQRTTLEHQAGGEQQKLDEDFLVALEHGMPPAGGIGIGIDRLCMMLLGQESIRDVILFPQLKPK
jgi:lysyl-tRNA synthetase class 2